LTIHDAKGMEFPMVVVPGVDQGFNHRAAVGDGQVEFERIGGHPAVGLRAPSAEDPFSFEDTMARHTIRERRVAEERAEYKRLLYVAMTRARDHLLLSGLHELAGEADEPTLTDLAAADPADPSSWRDWVQPAFIPEEVCAALDEEDRVETLLGRGVCTVALPTPPAEWIRAPSTTDPVVALPDPPATATPRI
ncbi:MAG: 3'-5' exonuclease, partial [Haloferacaceae archaeon]|nr:3'-5' exonuclease [Haloferacaceae archaeon]